MEDLKKARELQNIHRINTAVFPRRLIDALKEEYNCKDTNELLEILQENISTSIEKIICIDGLPVSQ